MSLYRNRYRIETSRLQSWDYASPGWYFVTLCTKDRACVFGKVVGGVMALRPAGKIVAKEWHRTPDVRPYVALDAFVVMPNHVHGLIGIRPTTPAARDGADAAGGAVSAAGTPRRVVETPRRVVETPRRGVSTAATANNTARLQPHSLGAIIGQFKSICTKRIRRAGYDDFAWQPRFHDRIVRDERSFRMIRQYILDNPARWQEDRLYSDT